MGDVIVRVKMKPPAAVGVPGDRQTLQPPPADVDQILLERLDTKRVLDLEVGHRAAGAVGIYNELAAGAEKPRSNAKVGKSRVVEVADDRPFRGHPHRQVVMRALPCDPL